MKHSNVCMHSIITSVLALAMSFQSPAALQCSAETAISDDKDLVITKDYDSNTPVLSKMGFYDANGNLVPIGTKTDLNSDIASLKAQIADGESNASKTGSFATEEDAKNGIAKIVLDAVGKPVTPAYDIVLVLDESGSMNMSMKAGNSAGDHKKLSPDLNPDHYYGIPAALLNDSDSGNAAYFQLSEFGSDAFVPWLTEDSRIWFASSFALRICSFFLLMMTVTLDSSSTRKTEAAMTALPMTVFCCSSSFGTE